MPSIFWFRRDLRLRDNPGLLAAANESRSLGDGEVVPLFVLDPRLWASAGPVRQAYLVASLASLDASLGGSLLIRHGDPLTCVPAVAAASNASSVHVAADFGPYGQERDFAVDRALGDVPFIRTGSPYAVAPDRVRKDDGTPYRVYTPFYRAWLRHRWPAPAAGLPPELRWSMPLDCHGFPDSPDLGQLVLPPAGEQAAWAQWERFRAGGLSTYAELRNRPDLAGTSALGHHLKWGEIHPRSLLAELTDEEEVFRKELCWREFYADVLYQRPDSARASLDAR
ncbi:MAG: deoxyribodipyrimidine photo-lyase, partial [Actinomycetes bacterium]